MALALAVFFDGTVFRECRKIVIQKLERIHTLFKSKSCAFLLLVHLIVYEDTVKSIKSHNWSDTRNFTISLLRIRDEIAIQGLGVLNDVNDSWTPALTSHLRTRK